MSDRLGGWLKTAKDSDMEPFEDTDNPGNSLAHRTGKRCIESGCGNPAGTGWSPYWCQPCNAKRMLRIGESLRGMQRDLACIGADPKQAHCPDIDRCEVSMGCLRLTATPCGCRDGECESKPGRACRMVAEIGTAAQ